MTPRLKNTDRNDNALPWIIIAMATIGIALILTAFYLGLQV